MDHIFIRDLRLDARVGFHKRERHAAQTLRLDLEIGIGEAAVFESDRVADCIDYANSIGREPSIAEMCLVAHVSGRRLRQALLVR